MTWLNIITLAFLAAAVALGALSIRWHRIAARNWEEATRNWELAATHWQRAAELREQYASELQRDIEARRPRP